MQRYKPQLASFAFLLLCVVSSAQAQSNPQQLAEVNQKAMEAYTNLDVEQARTMLEKAVQKAERAGIRGPALARTLSNLAVVLVGGLGDQVAGTATFERALKEDPKVEPDPIVATPEVMSSFAAAKARAGKGAAAVEAAPAPTAAPAPRSGPRRSAMAVEGNLDHTPAAEQLSQTAVPIFVRKSDDLEIEKIKLSYRSLGMQKPKTVTLAESDDGYTFLIPCTDVFEPVVEYFMMAVDDDGNTIGNAGSAQNPISVPIVSERTQPAPSLPGQLPPSQCSADNECPPGMPGCGGGAGMGATCSQSSDCESGLVCEDDFCVSGDGDDDDEEESSSSKKRFKGKRFFVDLNFGVGATSVSKGRSPDRTPAAIVNEVDSRSRVSGVLDEAVAQTELRKRGFDCKAVDSDGQLLVTDCSVAVAPAGFVPVAILNIAAGYFLTPKLAVAVTGRIQLARGEGPLAGTLVGARTDYLLTKPAPKGFRVGVLGAVTVGQMQARPPPAQGTGSGPFATNASPGGIGAAVSVGGRAGYRFMPNLGVNITPALTFGFPNLLFAFDATGGVEVAF